MDLITALGRLLHDGALRDEFAAQPSAVLKRLDVRLADRPALLALSFADLEFQAGILLGKRFDLIQRLVPQTLAALGERARRMFFAYARTHWPEGDNPAVRDASEFCRYCQQAAHVRVCQLELNRLKFELDQKGISMHFPRRRQLNNRERRVMQILMRGHDGKWRESIFFLGL